MKRIVMILILCLLVILCRAETAESKTTTLGLYFDPYGYRNFNLPPPFSFYDAYVILMDADHLVTGVEFMVSTPGDPSHHHFIMAGFSLPEGSLNIGDPLSGIGIVYWPPLNGFSGEPLLICTLKCLSLETCYTSGGDLLDYPITVTAHPESGELRGTYAPYNEFFPILGLTSFLCPYYSYPYLVNITPVSHDVIIAEFNKHVSDYSAEKESSYLVFAYSFPPDTLTVVNASRYSDESVRLALEGPMNDGMTYSLLASGIYGYSATGGSSRLDFLFDAAIGTLLRSFSAALEGAKIAVFWLMAEMDDGVEFAVLRAEGESEDFAAIPPPDISRDGLKFNFIDVTVEPGRTYRYRVEYVESGESRVLFETEPITTPALPLTLYQNVPNPFNPSTAIGYYLPEPCRVTLDIFDVSGRRIARLIDKMQNPGYQEASWNGRDENGRPAASGIYFYCLTAGKETVSKKMILLR
jgi:hypothetical protein